MAAGSQTPAAQRGACTAAHPPARAGYSSSMYVRFVVGGSGPRRGASVVDLAPPPSKAERFKAMAKGIGSKVKGSGGPAPAPPGGAAPGGGGGPEHPAREAGGGEAAQAEQASSWKGRMASKFKFSIGMNKAEQEGADVQGMHKGSEGGGRELEGRRGSFEAQAGQH
eukprot:752671-Prorocentrum_minimum.AAC.1